MELMSYPDKTRLKIWFIRGLIRLIRLIRLIGRYCDNIFIVYGSESAMSA